MDRTKNLIDILNKTMASYSLILIISGTILNPLIFYLCLRNKKLRQVSTFKLFAITSISDTLNLYIWNRDHFADTFFDHQLIWKNLFYCRLSYFMQYVTFQYSSWIWVSISLDRYISISVRKWAKFYFVGARPVLFAVLLAVIIFAINSIVIFKNGYVATVNGTEMVFCRATSENDYSWYITMVKVNDSPSFF
jgi:hypothetical protein